MNSNHYDWSNVRHFFVSSDYGQGTSVRITSDGVTQFISCLSLDSFYRLWDCWKEAISDRDVNSFNYPIALIRRNVYRASVHAFWIILGTMAVIFLLVFRPMTDMQRMLALVFVAPWPIVAVVRCLFQLRKKRVLTKVELVKEEIVVTYFEGCIVRYLVNDISRCCLEKTAHNVYIQFKDGHRINRLQNLI
jgi:hypothetical protein